MARGKSVCVMFSIIVPIHNGIAYNRLFLHSLSKYTACRFELIVVDNGSTDGSGELFLGSKARVIRNEGNRCYACSMNQGMQAATGRLLCFANNDLFFGTAWDVPLRKALENEGEWVVSPAGIEAAETMRTKNVLRRRWNWAGSPIRAFGPKDKVLRLSLGLMYGNWERFCEARHSRLQGVLAHGIQGNCIMARRELFDKIGPWDTRISAADWHLYLTVAKCAEEKQDVRRARIAADSYVHHFIRGTARRPYPPYECGHFGSDLSALWSREEMARFGWQGLAKDTD